MNSTEYNREYYAKHREEIKARSRAWRNANPTRAAVSDKAWTKANSKKSAFCDQKGHAKTRGIPFLFTFDQWVEWWGDDYAKRGRTRDALQMCRHGDIGPYAPWNVYKATLIQNLNDIKEHNLVYFKKNDGT